MQLEGRTILVTGGTGFVGGRVAAHLADLGASVRTLVRRVGAAALLDRPGIEELAGDVTEPDDVRAATEGVDAVVHCAAAIGDDVEVARRVNVDATRLLAEAALEQGVERFVHVSTGRVYARDGDVRAHEDADRIRDGDPYGVTKAQAEDVVTRAAGEGLPATILRPPAVLGWGPTSMWGQRIPDQIRDGTLPAAWGEESTYAWVHVDDLAAAVVLALTRPEAVGRTYNVVAGHETMGRYLDDVCGWLPDARRPQLTGPVGWTGTMPADRIRDELGWRPRTDYGRAMAESAQAWQRDQAERS